MNWNIFWGLYTLAFAVRYNDISLPVVEYTANGRTYTVVGPKFSATVSKSFSSPFHRVKTDIPSNLTTREDLPDVLKLNLRQNSLADFTLVSALLQASMTSFITLIFRYANFVIIV